MLQILMVICLFPLFFTVERIATVCLENERHVRTHKIFHLSAKYPLNAFEIDFDKNHYDRIYTQFAEFIEKFHGIDAMVASTSVDPLSYKSLYPIIMFDVSKQSERLKSGVTDITLQCRFKENVAANTVAHVIMISDRKIRFKSDEEKMTVMF